jgi:outer membrane immunogenic protein
MPFSLNGSKLMEYFVKNLILATAASTLVLAASPALAQAAPAGGRVEALVGYDSVKALGDDDGGVLYGVGAGYDVPVGRTVSFGADVEASDSTQKKSAGTASVKSGRDLYAGGRINLAISETANVYAKGGYTNARFKASDGVVSASENLEGYRLGAGAQFALRGKSYIGGEYRYSDYEGGLKRHQVAATVGTRF